MPLTTYAELVSSIAEWAARDDLTAQIPDFVMLAETMFNYGDQDQGIDPLRTRDMETSATVTVTSGVGTLPTDFLEAIRLTTLTNTLTYVSPTWYSEAYPSGDSTSPKFYTIIGSSLYVGADVTLVYYQKIGALESSLNWLFTKAPTVYLYGALYELYLFTKAPEEAAGFRALMAGAMGGLRRADKFSTAGSYERRASATAF